MVVPDKRQRIDVVLDHLAHNGRLRGCILAASTILSSPNIANCGYIRPMSGTGFEDIAVADVKMQVPT